MPPTVGPAPRIIAGMTVHRAYRRTQVALRELFRPGMLLHPLRGAALRADDWLRLHTLHVRSEGMRFSYPRSSIELALEVAEGRYEPEVTGALKAILRPGMNFVDGGAHFGYYSVLAARIVGPAGRVFAFEPIQRNYRYLSHNVGVNKVGKIAQTEPLAITSGQRKLQMHWSPWSPYGSNVVRQGEELASADYDGDLTSDSQVEVQGVDLDTYFSRLGWPSCDVVKLDIEGHEAAALEGMRELTRRNPQMAVTVELAPWTISPEEAVTLWQLLQDLGLKTCQALDGGGLRPVPTRDSVAALYHEVKSRPRHGSNVNLLCSKEPMNIKVA